LITPEIRLLQKHIARLNCGHERSEIGRGERFIPGLWLVQVAGDRAPDGVEHPAH